MIKKISNDFPTIVQMQFAYEHKKLKQKTSKCNPNSFFKAAARMLQIFCRSKTLNSTVFVVYVYAECIYIKIFCGPFPRQ